MTMPKVHTAHYGNFTFECILDSNLKLQNCSPFCVGIDIEIQQMKSSIGMNCNFCEEN